MPRETVHGPPIMDRYKALLGSQRKVAAYLGVSEKWVSDLSRDEAKAPRWLAVLVGFMERTAPADWPRVTVR